MFVISFLYIIKVCPAISFLSPRLYTWNMAPTRPLQNESPIGSMKDIMKMFLNEA